MKIENVSLHGMRGYVQCADPSRWSPPDAQGLMTSTVQAGDRWQTGGDTSDDRKQSERTEFRSLDEDTVGDGKVYNYECDLLIPSDYAEISPKSTFLQWHEGDYPVAFVRYEQGVLEFVLNYKSGLNLRRIIPFRKGRPVNLDFVFVWTPGPNAGRVVVLADNQIIVDEKGVSLVEPTAKSIYFKCGIYRSQMDRYLGPGPAPSQTVRHQHVSRSMCAVADLPRRFLAVLAPAPVPTPVPVPVPVPAATAPTPAPVADIREALGNAAYRLECAATSLDVFRDAIGASSARTAARNAHAALAIVDTVAARIAKIQTEITILAKDVASASAATLVTQAAEKLSKASAQIAKAAGKAA